MSKVYVLSKEVYACSGDYPGWEEAFEQVVFTDAVVDS